MKIVIVPDKFKGSISTTEACEAIKAGILSVRADAEIIQLPMADGGEGLLDVVSSVSGYVTKSATVLDPLFRPIEASYIVAKNNVAFIEMAKASGLMLLTQEERNPALTSSYGTGQLIKDALENGIKKIVLGIGGSATNDAGIGMAAALGFRFLDQQGKELKPTGENLIKVEKIDKTDVIDLESVTIEVACDVTNVLYGKNGAAYVYGPQKGADEMIVKQLDEGLVHIAEIIKNELSTDVAEVPGAGAAGGVGAGAIAFLGARLKSGIELMLDYSNAEEQIKTADLVLTGEGKLDNQSLNGKVVSGVTSLCQKHQKPLIVLCGRSELDALEYKAAGISNVYSIEQLVSDPKEAFGKAAQSLSIIAAKSISDLVNSSSL